MRKQAVGRKIFYDCVHYLPNEVDFDDSQYTVNYYNTIRLLTITIKS